MLFVLVPVVGVAKVQVFMVTRSSVSHETGGSDSEMAILLKTMAAGAAIRALNSSLRFILAILTTLRKYIKPKT